MHRSRAGDVVLLDPLKQVKQEMEFLESDTTPPRSNDHNPPSEPIKTLEQDDNVTRDLSELNLSNESVLTHAAPQGESQAVMSHRSKVQGQDDPRSEGRETSERLATEDSTTQTDSCPPPRENVAAQVTKKLEERLAERRLMYDPPEDEQAEQHGAKMKLDASEAIGKKRAVISTGKTVLELSETREQELESRNQPRLDTEVSLASSRDKGEVLMALLDKKEKLQAQLDGMATETQHVISRRKNSGINRSEKEKETGLAPSQQKYFKAKKGQFHKFLEDVSSSPDPQSEDLTKSGTSSEILQNIQRVTEQRKEVALNQKRSSSPKETMKQCPQLSPLELIRKTLLEWCTGDSLRYLVKRQQDSNTEESSEGFAAKYAALERRVDKQSQEDADSLLDEAVEIGANVATQAVPDIEKLRKESQAFELRVQEFYKGTDSSSGDKSRSKVSPDVTIYSL